MRVFGKFFSVGAVAASAASLPVMLVGAQEPLNLPAPLVQPVTGYSSGQNALSLDAAARAQNLGLPSLAADLYNKMLAEPGANREALTLAMTAALLDAGRAEEAEVALAALPEPRQAAWQLRAGLAALQLHKREAAQAAWDTIREDELPVADRAWYWFLAGALWDTAQVKDETKANEFYVRAETAAPTELARARFQLAAEKVRLRRLGVRSEAELKTTYDNYQRLRGSQTGYEFAEAYAVSLELAGREAEAVTFLQTVLDTLPREEAGAWDKLRLVAGLIGDRGRGGAGRSRLEQLLENGNNPERQRQALQLLADASRNEPERALFRVVLNRLIGGASRHPILENLYYFRAQLALAEADYVQAERDANALLGQFPGSPLRAHAFGVLTQSAWEQRRFRSVADNARKARAELPPTAGEARTELGIIEAEAAFRAGLSAGASGQGDFRTAADAYAAVLRERPAGMDAAKVGGLMLQRVLSEVKSGSGGAAKVLDELAGDPGFDLENRWQAEWYLARGLQFDGDTAQAYARVSRLLAAGGDEASADRAAVSPALVKPELRARMAWLQAKLSYEAGEFEQTLALVEARAATPIDVEASLKLEILGDMLLLKARAELALGRKPAALETFKRLRTEYPEADAAMNSYLIEAEHYASQSEIGPAKILLTSLIDNENPSYKNNEYIPYARFRLALLCEQLGRREDLEEANRRLEELVTSPAAENEDLIFPARLKQGDLLRRLNEFGPARQTYEELENKYPRRPDIGLAQLGLAYTHSAQAATDPGHAETARRKFEELRDRLDAPLDVRVEAGYNLGLLLATRGEESKAATVWWSDVIVPFLLEAKRPIEAGAKRPYWLARTLNDLGELYEKQGRLEEAKRVFRLFLDSRLGFEATPKKWLERYGVPTGAP